MNIENLRIAGDITKKVKGEIHKLVVEGTNILDIAESIENMISDEGAKPAFPVNICINEVTAHYTPSFNDNTTLKKGDLVKIDFGVLYKDAITDTAVSVNLNGVDNKGLIETAELALNRAIEEIEIGKGNGDIAKIIEKTIKERGFKPISNLSGHKIEENNLHAGIDIPNVEIRNTYHFKEGDVFAIEPFVTFKEAEGYVVDKNEVEIYSLYYPNNLRLKESRKILEYVVKEYGLLPFAERWIKERFGDSLLIRAALKELLKTKTFRAYPVLVEKSGFKVAQVEHTVYIGKEVEVIT